MRGQTEAMDGVKLLSAPCTEPPKVLAAGFSQKICCSLYNSCRKTPLTSNYIFINTLGGRGTASETRRQETHT